VYYDDLFILYCGNYIKFGRLAKKPVNNIQRYKNLHLKDFVLEPDNRENHLRKMNCTFDKEVEIIKLIETG
jgi:hypothetical protein